MKKRKGKIDKWQTKKKLKENRIRKWYELQFMPDENK